MDSVNELSCEFAASVLTLMRTTKQLEPDQAVSLIRNFYNALSPLMLQSDLSLAQKVAAPAAVVKAAEQETSGH